MITFSIPHSTIVIIICIIFCAIAGYIGFLFGRLKRENIALRLKYEKAIKNNKRMRRRLESELNQEKEETSKPAVENKF